MSLPRVRFGATARILTGVLLLVAVLFLAVFPTRTYLDQRESIDSARERLSVLRSENDRLEERIDDLLTPSEIERIAREEFNLARPGEEVFVIIPSDLEAVRRDGAVAGAVAALADAWGATTESED